MHHSDRESQYAKIRHSERLVKAGIEPSTGSRCDSYDNAWLKRSMACTRPELIHRRTWKARDPLNWQRWSEWLGTIVIG
jgi:putative transposase